MDVPRKPANCCFRGGNQPWRTTDKNHDLTDLKNALFWKSLAQFHEPVAGVHPVAIRGSGRSPVSPAGREICTELFGSRWGSSSGATFSNRARLLKDQKIHAF